MARCFFSFLDWTSRDSKAYEEVLSNNHYVINDNCDTINNGYDYYNSYYYVLDDCDAISDLNHYNVNHANDDCNSVDYCYVVDDCDPICDLYHSIANHANDDCYAVVAFDSYLANHTNDYADHYVDFFDHCKGYLNTLSHTNYVYLSNACCYK